MESMGGIDTVKKEVFVTGTATLPDTQRDRDYVNAVVTLLEQVGVTGRINTYILNFNDDPPEPNFTYVLSDDDLGDAVEFVVKDYIIVASFYCSTRGGYQMGAYIVSDDKQLFCNSYDTLNWIVRDTICGFIAMNRFNSVMESKEQGAS